MPVHDWSRVDADLFHDFHQTWTIRICDNLNAGVLPAGYSALVEPHVGELVPDAIVPRRRSRTHNLTGGILRTVPPKTRYVFQTSEVLAARGNRIVVRYRLGEVVCVMEIVSPGNKGSRYALRAFVEKAVEFLRQGVHLLIVDLLPPTKRDPQGIQQAILDVFEAPPFELPPDKPLTLAAYMAGDLAAGIETTVYVEPVGVGDVLPDMPAYLEPGGYVPVPLEATYQAAWASCPADMRELVETGKLAGEDEAPVS